MANLKYGVDYGLYIVRSPIVSLLCSIPILNLLYTKKLHFDVTYFIKTKNGAHHPATGTFKDIRVPLFAKRFRVVYALDHSAAKAEVYVYSTDRKWKYSVRSAWTNTELQPLVWYVSDIWIGKKAYYGIPKDSPI